ncbi:MAG TPA: FAD-dependent thymidylate synthase [Solirubrobacterales bacterium]
MSFDAKVLADSISPAGYRLTTLEATFPRFVLAEFNTHRVFSRNSASSRAIPIVKQLKRVLEDPYVPIEFGSNKPGMQAGAPLEGEKREAAERQWLDARDDAVRRVLGLVADPASAEAEAPLDLLARLEAAQRDKSWPEDWLNVHKQVANRLLEPFMWHMVIVTATEWDNFWNLRCHPDAQPEIRLIAELMRAAMEASEPSELAGEEWHLPLVRPEDRGEGLSNEELLKISAGRCARVSYLTHAGKRDLHADIELHDRLLSSGHMSPLEHPARPLTPAELARGEWSGNFRGWLPYRKEVPGEDNPLGHTISVTPLAVLGAG